MRAAVSDEDRWWEEASAADWWGERYGWTPEQVEALPVTLKDRMPGVAALKAELQAEKDKAASKR